ncbi:MAG TPA: hypothetical protein VGT98_06255, partial [Candidatus Elarobacter sp.]|nr:hypothetical protein [Candidatus Elarobacter sp.]
MTGRWTTGASVARAAWRQRGVVTMRGADAGLEAAVLRGRARGAERRSQNGDDEHEATEQTHALLPEARYAQP